MPQHAVALVPGFLGFDHVGGFTYWADRFLAALRADLERQCGRPFPVLPVPTPPIGSLASRQKALLRHLSDLDSKAGGPFTWHLVGHSTGGLDAAFLARTNPLVERPDGSEFDTATPLIAPQGGVRTVTTIATPHYGTCLALSDVAAMTAHGRFTWRGLREFAKAGYDVAARPGGLSLPRIEFALGSVFEGSTVQFLYHLLRDDKLANDLDPKVTTKLTDATNRRSAIPIFSIVTMTPEPMKPYKDDPLFFDLWTDTQEKALAPATPPPTASPTSFPVTIAPRSTVLPPTLTPRDNDGVVNTDRQWDGSPGGLVGRVLGDHGDVLGLYRRTDPVDGSVIESGLLTSGACFGDDQFFTMIGLVADGIARNVP
jgi:pimeloyl-ACP methyl ester carboxylesterase